MRWNNDCIRILRNNRLMLPQIANVDFVGCDTQLQTIQRDAPAYCDVTPVEDPDGHGAIRE